MNNGKILYVPPMFMFNKSLGTQGRKVIAMKNKENAKATEEAVVETTATTTKKSTKKDTTPKERVSYYLTVKVTFITPLLATNPNNKDIYSDFIAGSVNDEKRAEEVARLGVEEADAKGMTVFMRDPETGVPQLKDYTWLGFFKSRARALAKVDGSAVKGMTAYIKEIDDRMSVSPRFIDLILPEGGEITCNERPLRAETAMGPRVSLAKSEQVPEGTTCEFTIHTQTKEGMRMVIDCLEYGEERGTGQWRNAGNGCFTFEVLALDKETFKSKHQDAYDKLKEL